MTVQSLLIGLDGATFSLLDPLMEQGEMPFLRSFAAEGVRAGLRSVVPPLTPPAWSSMLTGRSPGQHGIFDFFQLHAAGSRQIRLATSNDLRCATIAQLANRAGKRAMLLNFPITFPPPAIDGQVIAGWMPWRQLRLGCHPPQLYDQLKEMPGFDPRMLAMDMALEARATEGCNEAEYVAWVELHQQRDQGWATVAGRLMREYGPELACVMFDGPDKIQHLCWRFLDPALLPAELSPGENQIRQACLTYFRQLDKILAELAALAGPEATVVIASDHGFGATTEVFHINSWLEQAGYLYWQAAARPEDSQPAALGMTHLARHNHWFDWERTTVYCATPTSNGLHIVVADRPDGPGVPPEQYHAFREELIAALRRVVDPASGEAAIAQVWRREEIFAGPAQDLAPDLTIALRDGGLVSILPAREVNGQVVALQPREVPVGTHRPVGVLMACGPGLRRGLALEELSILDVAPLLLHSLGLAIPADLEGRAPGELLEPVTQRDHPVAYTTPASYAQPAASSEAVYDEESEAIILERLRALGYVE